MDNNSVGAAQRLPRVFDTFALDDSGALTGFTAAAGQRRVELSLEETLIQFPQ